MSFNFNGLPTQTFPSPTNPAGKDVQVKAVKLTFADFTTGGAARVGVYIPADASIIGFRLWVKTQLSGNGITAATLSVGIPGNATKYTTTGNAFGAVASYSVLGTNAIFQEYDPTAPGGDVPILFTGTATTGNPTAGEMYVLVEYVR